MKRTILATCLAGACAVVLSAQTPTQQPPTGTSGATTGQEKGTQQRNRPMTISGCLKAGDTAGTYMLTNVKGMGRPSGAAGTTGETTGGATTTAPQGSQRGMNEVMLTAASDVDLKPHVGHQIEVTGTPSRGQGTGSTAGGTTTGGTTTGGTTAGGTTAGGTAAGGTTTATTGQGTRGMRNLTVTSVKMISDTCSQQ
jgi:hypothetical protein